VIDSFGHTDWFQFPNTAPFPLPMRPDDDDSPAPCSMPRTSGVFSTLPRAPQGLSTAQILAALRSIVPTSAIGVMLGSCCGQPLRALVDPPPQVAPDLHFALELRMAAWLASVHGPRAPIVPEHLKLWLPFERAVAVPCFTPAWQAGVLVTDSEAVDNPRLRSLTELAAEVALELETADRYHCRRVLREVVDTKNAQRIPSFPNWRTG
jgi:hypothetical protein